MRGDVPSHSCEGRGTESHDGMGGGGISWLTGEAKQGKQGRKGWFVPSSALPECQSLPTSRQTVKEKGVLLPTPHNFPSPSPPPPLSLSKGKEKGESKYLVTARHLVFLRTPTLFQNHAFLITTVPPPPPLFSFPSLPPIQASPATYSSG